MSIAFNAAGASAANASIVPDTVESEAQPLTGTVAAVSVGIGGGGPLLDLAYAEDVKAETDINVRSKAHALVREEGVRKGPAKQAPRQRLPHFIIG